MGGFASVFMFVPKFTIVQNMYVCGHCTLSQRMICYKGLTLDLLQWLRVDLLQ